jgi:hypothetical protein
MMVEVKGDHCGKAQMSVTLILTRDTLCILTRDPMLPRLALLVYKIPRATDLALCTCSHDPTCFQCKMKKSRNEGGKSPVISDLNSTPHPQPESSSGRHIHVILFCAVRRTAHPAGLDM